MERKDIVLAWQDKFNGMPKISVNQGREFFKLFNHNFDADFANEEIEVHGERYEPQSEKPCRYVSFIYLDDAVKCLAEAN